MTDPIGNVIRILDKFTIIINVGSDELSVGDTIQVYENLDDIVDLDGTVLDSYAYIKDELNVIQVENRYSVCKKDKVVTHTSSFSLSPLLERTFRESVPLNIDESELVPAPPIDKAIHVGDKVKKMA